MTANIHHGETVDAEPVLLAVVATETVIGNAVAVVTAALLPGAVLRLPAMCTVPLPSGLLASLGRAPFLCRPVVLLLTLMVLLFLPSGLLLPRRVVLLLTPLLVALLILLLLTSLLLLS